MEDSIAIENINVQRIFLTYGFEHVPTLIRLTKDSFNKLSR
jgi:hypothetical protein